MLEISSSPVLAVIVTYAVMSVPALVMNIFEPLITHCPSRSSAVVRVLPASEPAPASVSPNAELLAGRQIGQPLALLLLGAVVVDQEGLTNGAPRR